MKGVYMVAKRSMKMLTPWSVKMSWKSYNLIVKDLVKKIKRSDFVPSLVLYIPKGGAVIGTNLAYVFNCKIYPISEYRKFEIDLPCFAKVLLVDDISDTGETFNRVIKQLKQKLVSEIKTASLLMRKGSKFKPNFVGKVIEHKKYIDFPWERI
jgi:hypoxanthine phosphoribosyltransferase